MHLEAPTSATQLIHFRDHRPPEQIQFQLERDLVALFQPVPNEPRTTARGMVMVGYVPYYFDLVFEAALAWRNCFSLRIFASWEHRPKESHAGCLRDTQTWFDHYTRHLQRTAPPAPGEGSAERYAATSRQWMLAEEHLQNIAAIQNAILTAMKRGAAFSGSTKEGAWRIDYHHGAFHGAEDYRDEREFLTWLRQYFDVTVSRSVWPETVSDYDAWKLIYRLLDRSERQIPGASWLQALGSRLRA